MGYTVGSCALSGLSIYHGDPVACFPLARNRMDAGIRQADRNNPHVHEFYSFYYFAMLPMYGPYSEDHHTIDGIEPSLIWDHYEAVTGCTGQQMLNQVHRPYPFVPISTQPYPVCIMHVHRELYEWLEPHPNSELVKRRIERIANIEDDAHDYEVAFCLSGLNLAPPHIDTKLLAALIEYIPKHDEYRVEIERIWALMAAMQRMNRSVLMPSTPGSQDGESQYQYNFMSVVFDMAERSMERSKADDTI